jgi:hypothetical protein
MTHRSVIHRLGLLVAAVAGTAAVTGTAAYAHHSFNAYDMSKTETVSGAIKEFRWGAPHSSVVVIYVDKNGTQQRRAISIAATRSL